MPFPDRTTDVAGRFQELRQYHFRHGQSRSRISVVTHWFTFVTESLLIATRQQTRTRWAAKWVCCIAAGAANSVRRQGIDVRCEIIRTSVKTYIAITEMACQ